MLPGLLKKKKTNKKNCIKYLHMQYAKEKNATTMETSIITKLSHSTLVVKKSQSHSTNKHRTDTGIYPTANSQLHTQLTASEVVSRALLD